MRRFPWWAVLGPMLVLPGCFLPGEDEFLAERERTCGTDFTCPEGHSCKSGFCEPDFLVVEPSSCSPGCAPYQLCARFLAGAPECVDSYSELKLLAPAQGSAVSEDTVAVRAQLVPSPGVAPEYPERLEYRVVQSDGWVMGEGTMMATEAGSGMYAAQWTPPVEGGVFEVTAAYPAEGGPSAKAQVTVDRTPPALSMMVPEPEPRLPMGGFAYDDPGATSPSWRRDQTARVVVRSDSADMDPSSLSVRVRGFAGGEDVTDLSLAPVTPCETASCWSVEVPLWRPGLPAFRGSFTVEVTAKDLLGNQALATGSIPVTRWRWAFDGQAGAIWATPAIGQLGTVYFGTSSSYGKVFALNPEGSKKWETPLGDVLGSPAVGTYSSGFEMLYVGANTEGNWALHALGPDGVTVSRCPGSGATREILASIAMTSTWLEGESGPVETAVALSNGYSLLALRPTATSSTRQCLGLSINAIRPPGTNIIARGVDVYFGTMDQVQSYQFSGSGWISKPGYTVPRLGTEEVAGLGISSDGRIVGAAGHSMTQTGGVFSFLAADGSGLWKHPEPFSLSAPVRNMSIGEGNQVFFGRAVGSGTAELTAIDLGATEPRLNAPNAGSFPGAPVLGAGGALYTASAGLGEVSAWNAADLTRRWKLSDTVGPADASPTLDCVRNTDGSASSVPVGVLYVPSVDGKLYAFVVDSRGLETAAPWPKYQHDARNTGNPATPISSCP